MLGFVKDGRLRGIATTGSKRDFVLPELPTVAESGLPGYDMPLWFGLAAPKGTPRPVIEKLSASLKATLVLPDVKQALDKQGFAPMEMGPEEFGRFYVAEAAKWARLVNAIGLAH